LTTALHRQVEFEPVNGHKKFILPKLRLWHELLTLGFVKGTHGYVKKAEPKPCL
jgi:hypothetical protein